MFKDVFIVEMFIIFQK